MFSYLTVALLALLSLPVLSCPLSSPVRLPWYPPTVTTLSTSSTTNAAATPTVVPVSRSVLTTVPDNSPHIGGFATYYLQYGAAGACGQVHSDSDLICAMNQNLFGTSGPNSPLCNQQVQIMNTANNATVTVTIVDDCPGCRNEESIDLSVGAFQALAPLSDGVIDIQWVYV